MKIELPRAEKVTPLTGGRLLIQWTTGEALEVDLSERLKENIHLKHLLKPAVFSKAHPADHGASIEWEDSELGADNIYAWTKEQMGETSHEMFFGWMQRNGLTLDTAATALGMSRRMIAYYRSGKKPVPKYIWLACKGWEVTQNEQAKRTKAA